DCGTGVVHRVRFDAVSSRGHQSIGSASPRRQPGVFRADHRAADLTGRRVAAGVRIRSGPGAPLRIRGLAGALGDRLARATPRAPWRERRAERRMKAVPRARTLVIGALSVVVAVFSWLFRFNDPGGSFAGLTDDHFFYLVRGWQILFGDLPVRDFVDHGAPLYYYIAAAVQTVLGRGTFSEVLFSSAMLGLSAALVFWLAARASGSILLGIVGALFFV